MCTYFSWYFPGTEYRSRTMWHAFGTLEHSRTFFMHVSHIIFKTLFCAFIISLSLFSCCYWDSAIAIKLCCYATSKHRTAPIMHSYTGEGTSQDLQRAGQEVPLHCKLEQGWYFQCLPVHHHHYTTTISTTSTIARISTILNGSIVPTATCPAISTHIVRRSDCPLNDEHEDRRWASKTACENSGNSWLLVRRVPLLNP